MIAGGSELRLLNEFNSSFTAWFNNVPSLISHFLILIKFLPPIYIREMRTSPPEQLSTKAARS